MDVQRISSESPWEDRIGFSRAVRVGGVVLVSGTTAITRDGAIAGGGDAYLQACAALDTIAAALAEAGASLDDVVQTRIYVTDASRAEEVGRAHAEAFAATRPAATMVEVPALADPRMLVEIEAVAVLGGA